MNTAPVRLRRLEVQGFKSFATRTAFEFGPGVTAIVGPNGSGKSNLADAIRWVLGEQNPRMMRLRRLEDVIFAGGGRRAQSGFAEVSIVLDNSEGWLPIDFEELVVTRRLHRSGESEYLLNRRRVRLRDILDLFLKGQLGQNSYAILGQGMVDMVLSLRPEERRSLIEEAADVRRHRLKIEEATDQLSATRDNRDRVELLIAEIGPRLAQLERQAQRAGEHAALSRELAEYIRLLYLRRTQEAIRALRSAHGRHAAAVQEAESGAERLRLAEEKLAKARAVAEAAELDLRQLESRSRTLDNEEAAAERVARSASDRLPYLDERRREIERDLVALEEEMQALAAEVTGSSSPTQEVEQADQALGDAESRLVGAKADLETARLRLVNAETGVRAAQEQQASMRERTLRLEAERRRLEREGARVIERRRGALLRLNAWAVEYREAQRRLREAERRTDAGRKTLAEQLRRSQMAAAALGAGESVLAELTARQEAAGRRLEILEGEREARRPAEDIIVGLLDALRGGGPGRPRVLGILGGLMHVQRGYEIAIEAALADALNGLVVRSEREALAAISVLQQIEGGRLIFFALEGPRGAHTLNIASENGVLGVAARFVRCDDEYRDLLDSLLGRIVVVEDIETARRIARRGLGSAVTLDGTLLRTGGMISGGRGKADGYVFEAGRELADLQEEHSRLLSERATEAERVATLREQADEAHERTRSLEASVVELERHQEGTERSLAALRRRLEPLKGELEWIRTHIADAEASRSSLDTMLLAPESAADPSASDLARLETTLAVERREFQQAQERQSAASASVAEARGRRSALLSERAALETLQRSRVDARERTERLIAARRASLRSITGERDLAEADLVRYTEALRERHEAAEEAREGLLTTTQRAREVNAAVHALADEVVEARTASAIGERARLDAELALARASEDVEHLRDELQAQGMAFEADSMAGGGGEELEEGPSPRELEAGIRRLRRVIRELGAVNEEAEADYRESKDRFDFLTAQVTDLREAETALMGALDQLRQIVREQFRSTFQAINADFQVYFRTFFGGGQARLALTEPEDYGESGVDIIAQPPGKRLQNLAMLSGGERSMTAVALLFALLESNPAPFCVLDEVDAALDEANVGRFSDALARLAGRSQFLVITHNRGTVQAADQIYGVSMTGDGISNVLSMRLSDATPLLA